MTRPLVSIVISNYNYGRFLAEAIESTLQQDCSYAEVIVVDDGSTDDSRKVMRSYGNAIVSIFQNHSGQASAWNAGVVVSHGKWVLFLDSDDRLADHAIGTIVANGTRNPAASKIHWRMHLIGELGQRLGVSIPDGPLPNGDRFSELIEFGFDRGPNLATSGNSWSTKFLEQVLPIPETPFLIGADTYLLGLSPLFGTTCAIDSFCSEYRCHKNNNGAAGPARIRAAEIIRQSSLVFDRIAVELTKRGFQVNPERWKEVNPTFIRYRRIAEGLDDDPA